MYGELFNEAADEEEFSAFLGTPTRQAVALARAYNSKERKLQISSTSRGDARYEEGTPGFVQIIEKLREEADNRGLLSRKMERRSVWSDAPAELDPEIPFIPTVRTEPVNTVPQKPADRLEYVEPDNSELTFDDLPPISADDAEDEDEPEEVMAVLEKYGREEASEPERKVNVPLAVLYAIIAIPVTVLITCLLLIPTFVSLGLSGGCLFIGFKVAASAFGGFSMFSDIMVVLGSAVIILALGVLFLWLFIWFIGGAIAGVINAAIKLGSKWCSREVKE